MDLNSAKDRTVCVFGLRYVGYPLADALSRHLRTIGCSLRRINPRDVDRMLEKVPAICNRKPFIVDVTGCRRVLYRTLWSVLVVLRWEQRANYASLIEMTTNCEWESQLGNVPLTKPDLIRSAFGRRKLLLRRAAR